MPAPTEPTCNPPGDSAATAPTPSKGPVVLVVDDSRFVRASLVRGLSGRYPVLQADGGAGAWEALARDPSITVVLSDLSMPEVDGFELLHRVRTSDDPRLRRLPFAVLSGADDPAHRERAGALGADRFVIKGQPLESLCTWIDAVGHTPEQVPGSGTAFRSTGEVDPSDVTHPSDVTDPSDASGSASHPAAAPEPSTVPVHASAGASAPDGDGGSTADVAAAPERASLEGDRPGDAPATDDRDEPARPGVEPPTSARVGRSVANEPSKAAAAVSLRLEAHGSPSWADRLRRGVRHADALMVDPLGGALLRVAAGDALALRLALRLGWLAAGPAARDDDGGARVTLRIGDPADGDATPVAGRGPVGLTLVVFADGRSSRRVLRWSVVRMLVGPAVAVVPA